VPRAVERCLRELEGACARPIGLVFSHSPLQRKMGRGAGFKLDACSDSELNGVINRMFGNEEALSGLLPWKDVWSCRGGKENNGLRRGGFASAADMMRVLQPRQWDVDRELNRANSSGSDSCPGTPEVPRKQAPFVKEGVDEPRLTSMYSQLSGFQVDTNNVRKPRAPIRPPPSPPR
jgi:hypothetical protein